MSIFFFFAPCSVASREDGDEARDDVINRFSLMMILDDARVLLPAMQLRS